MAVKGIAKGILAAATLGVAAALHPPFASAHAETSDAHEQASAADFGVAPWTEVVVSVADPDQSAQWLIEDGGWRELARGSIERAELEYWGLPASVSADFLKICAPETLAGCIRYVRFDGAQGQRPIRPAARPWDTGGIFSIMLRSDDAQAMFDAAIARGWWAESPPYSFSFGGSDLVNVVIRGPHGVNYALYQRKAPPFDGFAVGKLSQAFNTMRMVRNQPASLAWYRDRLGLVTLFDAPFTDPEPRPNNFSVPANLATQLVRRAAVVQPRLPGEDGRMELMQFEGFEGRDHSAHASPPNFGIISVRYPVRDLEGYTAFLEARGVAIEQRATGLAIAALRDDAGATGVIAVRDPDGNLTEFYDVD